MNKLIMFITVTLMVLVSTSIQDPEPASFNPNWDLVKELVNDWDDADDFIPQPLVNLGGRIYYFEPNLFANWYSAFEFCRRLDMFLVTVETKEENDLIKEYITQVGIERYWTSGSDLAKINEYVWSATGERITFADWLEGQPDHGNNLEFAILYMFVNNIMGWADGDPKAAVHFICEQP